SFRPGSFVSGSDATRTASVRSPSSILQIPSWQMHCSPVRSQAGSGVRTTDAQRTPIYFRGVDTSSIAGRSHLTSMVRTADQRTLLACVSGRAILGDVTVAAAGIEQRARA